jgi:hypothetical protein
MGAFSGPVLVPVVTRLVAFRGLDVAPDSGRLTARCLAAWRILRGLLGSWL